MKQLLFAILLALPLSAANLIQNPGFEDPVLGSTFTNIAASNSLPGWVWAGPGQGLLHRTDYSELAGTLLFPAHSGQNALDMTGPGWTGANELYQDITTVIGQSYEVTFWLGNQDDNVSSYLDPSSLELMIGATTYSPFSHSQSGNLSVEWVQFSQQFIASTATTRILFRNTTPSPDNYLGLDDVMVDDQSAVPEPSTIVPFAAGLALAILRHRR